MQHAKGLSAVGFKSPSADSILSVATCCACALGLRFAWYLSLVASIPLRVLRRAAVADVTCSWSGCQRLRKWARARPHPALTALILPNLRMQRDVPREHDNELVDDPPATPRASVGRDACVTEPSTSVRRSHHAPVAALVLIVIGAAQLVRRYWYDVLPAAVAHHPTSVGLLPPATLLLSTLCVAAIDWAWLGSTSHPRSFTRRLAAAWSDLTLPSGKLRPGMPELGRSLSRVSRTVSASAGVFTDKLLASPSKLRPGLDSLTDEVASAVANVTDAVAYGGQVLGRAMTAEARLRPGLARVASGAGSVLQAAGQFSESLSESLIATPPRLRPGLERLSSFKGEVEAAASRAMHGSLANRISEMASQVWAYLVALTQPSHSHATTSTGTDPDPSATPRLPASSTIPNLALPPALDRARALLYRWVQLAAGPMSRAAQRIIASLGLDRPFSELPMVWKPFIAFAQSASATSRGALRDVVGLGAGLADLANVLWAGGGVPGVRAWARRNEGPAIAVTVVGVPATIVATRLGWRMAKRGMRALWRKWAGAPPPLTVGERWAESLGWGAETWGGWAVVGVVDGVDWAAGWAMAVVRVGPWAPPPPSPPPSVFHRLWTALASPSILGHLSALHVAAIVITVATVAALWPRLAHRPRPAA